MHEYILFCFLCSMMGSSNTFSSSSSAAFNNGTWVFLSTNTSSSSLGNQHALAVLLNHASMHENNGNHFGNIHNGSSGNGNGVNHNQHDNGNAIQALCRKICVRNYPCPPECSYLQPWSIIKRTARERRNRVVKHQSGPNLSLVQKFNSNLRDRMEQD